MIDDVRYSVPGDRARIDAEALVELHGRDSVTINSGGEKIFAEEIEAALAHHRGVYDVVVAIVVMREGAEADEAGLLEVCAQNVARYKLPKDIVFVDAVARSPAGKADHRWAMSVAERSRFS